MGEVSRDSEEVQHDGLGCLVEAWGSFKWLGIVFYFVVVVEFESRVEDGRFSMLPSAATRWRNQCVGSDGRSCFVVAVCRELLRIINPFNLSEETWNKKWK